MIYQVKEYVQVLPKGHMMPNGVALPETLYMRVWQLTPRSLSGEVTKDDLAKRIYRGHVNGETVVRGERLPIDLDFDIKARSVEEAFERYMEDGTAAAKEYAEAVANRIVVP